MARRERHQARDHNGEEPVTPVGTKLDAARDGKETNVRLRHPPYKRHRVTCAGEGVLCPGPLESHSAQGKYSGKRRLALGLRITVARLQRRGQTSEAKHKLYT